MADAEPCKENRHRGGDQTTAARRIPLVDRDLDAPADPHVADRRHCRAAVDLMNRHKDHVGDPIEYQGAANIRQIMFDKIERLSQCNRQARETGGSSSCPSGEESDAT